MDLTLRYPLSLSSHSLLALHFLELQEGYIHSVKLPQVTDRPNWIQINCSDIVPKGLLYSLIETSGCLEREHS